MEDVVSERSPKRFEVLVDLRADTVEEAAPGLDELGVYVEYPVACRDWRTPGEQNG
jgi:hypothetical protein